MTTKRQVLERLKRDELLAAVAAFSLTVADRRRRQLLLDALGGSPKDRLTEFLATLSRQRLKEICRDLGLDDGGRGKAVLAARLAGRPGCGELRPVVVDYFCGGGGFTCGALSAGAIVACGIDCDERARATYVENNRNPEGDPVPYVLAQVEALDPAVVSEHLAPYWEHPTIFVGCPPCQPFTNLRTTKEHPASSRDALRAFMDHVEALFPDFVVVENVPGIRARKYGALWEESVERLKKLGYEVRYEIVNAARYGVPQKRLRTLLVACKSEVGQPPWPAETHTPERYRTVRDTFGETDLCDLEAGHVSESDSLHAAAALSQLNLRRIRAITKPGGSRTEWPKELSLECYRGHDGHTDVYGRMDWDSPAPTLTTRFVSLSNGRFGHPEEDRGITPREGALLQTFPPDYKFIDPSRDMKVIYIGNAVPPRLARSIIGAIKDHLTETGTDR